MNTWVLLVYKVPSTPTAARVYVWRKLKQLGAHLLHDSVWVLPANERTREQFQWLAAEVREWQGEAFVWEANSVLVDQEEQLRRYFLSEVDAEYQILLDELAKPGGDAAQIAQRYQQLKVREYLPSQKGDAVRAKLLSLRSVDPKT